jgi:hypothetical protein
LMGSRSEKSKLSGGSMGDSTPSLSFLLCNSSGVASVIVAAEDDRVCKNCVGNGMANSLAKCVCDRRWNIVDGILRRDMEQDCLILFKSTVHRKLFLAIDLAIFQNSVDRSIERQQTSHRRSRYLVVEPVFHVIFVAFGKGSKINTR